MLIRKKLPPEVSDNIVSWLTTTSVPQMNRDVLLGLAEDFGEIELDIGGNCQGTPSKPYPHHEV